MSALNVNNLLKKQKLGQKSIIYNKFILQFLAAAFLPVISVGVFNYIVDPYDVFNTPNFLGINHDKPKKDSNDRQFKALDITRIKPTTIIIGSSRTKQGIDPEHPILAKDPSTYNLAINGPNVYEVRRYLEHAIANQPNLKEVIFGIDFFMFNANLKNQPSFSEARLGIKHIAIGDAVNALFSIDTYHISKETIEASLKEPNKSDRFGENGFMPNRKFNDGNTKWRFEQAIKLYFQLHSTYELSEQYLDDFKKIVSLCKEKNIPLKVFISPAHATDLEAIRVTGKWQVMEQWQREIVKIVPVWDFSGYNSVTTESTQDVMKNYADNSHYSSSIGNYILDRLGNYQIDKVPQDFGVLITPENIESHLEQTRQGRETWAKEHPEELKLVETIKQQTL
jgi:hypothetical protein